MVNYLIEVFYLNNDPGHTRVYSIVQITAILVSRYVFSTSIYEYYGEMLDC